MRAAALPVGAASANVESSAPGESQPLGGAEKPRDGVRLARARPATDHSDPAGQGSGGRVALKIGRGGLARYEKLVEDRFEIG